MVENIRSPGHLSFLVLKTTKFETSVSVYKVIKHLIFFSIQTKQKYENKTLLLLKNCDCITLLYKAPYHSGAARAAVENLGKSLAVAPNYIFLQSDL